MKSLLWTILFAAVAANVFFSLATSGTVTLICSIATGILTIATGLSLWMLRDSRPGRRT
jgi:hypothetical protein